MFSSIKINLIIIGVILVLFSVLSLSLYISIKNNNLKQAEIKNLNSVILKNKAVCDKEKLELIYEINQLEKDFIAKSIKYKNEQEKKNKVVTETVIVEKEINKEIFDGLKDGQDFSLIWIRVNDILQL